ncbi:MAG: histidine phosphatase family protein [Clostridia bacterium]|nr:histidine phosphatase family protein [Clostridia bacterium]
MTDLYFIRHAESRYDADDRTRGLSDKGLRDRALSAEFLADKSVDAVLSSPYRRAVETVEVFAEERGMKVLPVEDFRERCIADVWVEDFREFTRRQWEDHDYKLGGGESLREVQRRNIAALTDVLRQYAGKTVAVGTHGMALSTIIQYFVPSFGWEDFDRIRGKMPWAVHFVFNGGRCIRIEGHDLFEGTVTRYL